MTAIRMKSLFSRMSRCRATGPAATSANTASGVLLVRRLMTFVGVAFEAFDTLYVCIWIEAVHSVVFDCASDDDTYASIGALVVGLRYRRNAGVGVSSNLGGIRSSVNGTRGSIVMIDLVRKSSGVIIGVVMLDIDRAAARSAFNEAVKFDLNADLRRGCGVCIRSDSSGSQE